jgi:hypothetical protein
MILLTSSQFRETFMFCFEIPGEQQGNSLAGKVSNAEKTQDNIRERRLFDLP